MLGLGLDAQSPIYTCWPGLRRGLEPLMIIYKFSSVARICTCPEMKFDDTQTFVESSYSLHSSKVHWGVNFEQMADNAEPDLGWPWYGVALLTSVIEMSPNSMKCWRVYALGRSIQRCRDGPVRRCGARTRRPSRRRRRRRRSARNATWRRWTAVRPTWVLWRRPRSVLTGPSTTRVWRQSRTSRCDVHRSFSLLTWSSDIRQGTNLVLQPSLILVTNSFVLLVLCRFQFPSTFYSLFCLILYYRSPFFCIMHWFYCICCFFNAFYFHLYRSILCNTVPVWLSIATWLDLTWLGV